MAARKKQTFADAKERLDEILAELEDDSGDVDKLAARVKEAAELIRFCRGRLAEARQEVTEVVASLDAETRAAGDEAEEDRDEDPADDGDDDDAEGQAAEGLPF